MKLDDVTLDGQRIELSDNEVNFLGPGLSLNKCTIVSDCSAKALVVAGLRMSEGLFKQTRPLRNFPFDYAHFEGVSFLGDYIGCDFGNWDSAATGSVNNCDFSAANLDGCRFLRCDASTINFPKWPNFTILSPATARESVTQLQWPDRLKGKLAIYTDTDPECVAMVGDARRIAGACEVSLDDLKALLKRLQQVSL